MWCSPLDGIFIGVISKRENIMPSYWSCIGTVGGYRGPYIWVGSEVKMYLRYKGTTVIFLENIDCAKFSHGQTYGKIDF